MKKDKHYHQIQTHSYSKSLVKSARINNIVLNINVYESRSVFCVLSTFDFSTSDN